MVQDVLAQQVASATLPGQVVLVQLVVRQVHAQEQLAVALDLVRGGLNHLTGLYLERTARLKASLPLHFHQAHAAGTHGVHPVLSAQGGHVLSGTAAHIEQVLAVLGVDLLSIQGQR